MMAFDPRMTRLPAAGRNLTNAQGEVVLSTNGTNDSKRKALYGA
jgi:hypothetical protein